jgi:hypothetical protein
MGEKRGGSLDGGSGQLFIRASRHQDLWSGVHSEPSQRGEEEREKFY